MFLVSTNPARNYEEIGRVRVATKREVMDAVAAAKKAQEQWRIFSAFERAEIIKNLIPLIRREKETLARFIVAEMGKPITEARSEVEGAIGDVEYFVAHGPGFVAEQIVRDDQWDRDTVSYEPWGVAGVITPWNYPLAMPVWGVIPNLIVGNTVVFKPSEETPLTGQKFAELLEQIGLPQGVFSIVHGKGDVGEMLVEAPLDLIWFTGSSKVGQKIFAQAGKKFIKAVLELGGSSPAIVCEDADIDCAAREITAGRFSNCGQVCTAVKRLFVHRKIYKKFIKELVWQVAQIKVGDPQDENSKMGPLAAKRQLLLLESQVKDAKTKGAKVLIGGKRPRGLKGAYYLPTILTHVKNTMAVIQEEVFGPTLPVMVFKDFNRALALANNTPYGLSAEVFTRDKARMEQAARALQAGTVAFNTDNFFSLDCPFGGYKKSGMGREHGVWGFRELTQVKHVRVKKQ